MALMDRFSEFICDTNYENIPKETVEYTKILTSKIAAAMLCGAKTRAGKRAVEYCEASTGIAEAGAVGTEKKFSLEDAAFINGITCHAAELEDDQFPSATSDITIFPVVFPLAENIGATGKELITASAIGIEVMNRVGMFPLSSKGITDLPFYGVIGAAVTAAKMLKLNKEQIKNAIGISIGRAGGYIVNFGTDAHYVESACACRDGVMAAKLAKIGMTGSWDIERWIDNICEGTNYDVQKIAASLGKPKWRVHETWIKKYPCCFLTHRHIDMILDILSNEKISDSDVKKIEIHVGPVDYVCNRPVPKDTEDARFSFQHIMGSILVDGDIDIYHFTDESLKNEKISLARKKVNVNCHFDWPAEFMSGTAKIEVKLNSGRQIIDSRIQARGGPDEPLNQKEAKILYDKYTRNVMNSDKIEKSWKMISSLEDINDLAEFFNLFYVPES